MELRLMGRPLERFCKRGHDTHEVGRIRKGWCKACAYIADANGGVGGKPKLGHDPEWTNARVARWLKIVEEDPIAEGATTQGRFKAFNDRYARLEAEVPTP